MSLQPSFRRQAFLEFVAARHWYEEQKPGLGTQFEAEIDHALVRACASPQHFPEVISHVHRIRVARFPFVIYFRVRDNMLIVLAVFHSRRNPTIWQKRTSIRS